MTQHTVDCPETKFLKIEIFNLPSHLDFVRSSQNLLYHGIRKKKRRSPVYYFTYEEIELSICFRHLVWSIVLVRRPQSVRLEISVK